MIGILGHNRCEVHVFAFEHVCGGGMLNEPLPEHWLRQGTAMLRAVADDLVRGGVRVSTIRDARVDVDLNGADVATVSDPQRFEEEFEGLAHHADAALVIAPESQGLLGGWCTRIEQLNARSLGCSLDAIEVCSDKLQTARRLSAAGVPTPPTWLLHELPCRCWPRSATYVFKPQDGAGCEDTTIVRSRDYEAMANTLRSRDDMIVQPSIVGLPVSVSLIVHENRIRPLLAGQQIIRRNGGNNLVYDGGIVPLAKNLQSRAMELAISGARCIEGLNGFVGVDLILGKTHDDDCVIEINPRLTVSYVGLSALCRTNLALAMLEPKSPLRWLLGPLYFDAAGRVEREGSP